MIKIAKIVFIIQLLVCIFLAIIMFKSSLVAGRHVFELNRIATAQPEEKGKMELSEAAAWAISIRNTMPVILGFCIILSCFALLGISVLFELERRNINKSNQEATGNPASPDTRA